MGKEFLEEAAKGIKEITEKDKQLSDEVQTQFEDKIAAEQALERLRTPDDTTEAIKREGIEAHKGVARAVGEQAEKQFNELKTATENIGEAIKEYGEVAAENQKQVSVSLKQDTFSTVLQKTSERMGEVYSAAKNAEEVANAVKKEIEQNQAIVRRGFF